MRTKSHLFFREASHDVLSFQPFLNHLTASKVKDAFNLKRIGYLTQTIPHVIYEGLYGLKNALMLSLHSECNQVTLSLQQKCRTPSIYQDHTNGIPFFFTCWKTTSMGR